MGREGRFPEEPDGDAVTTKALRLLGEQRMWVASSTARKEVDDCDAFPLSAMQLACVADAILVARRSAEESGVVTLALDGAQYEPSRAKPTDEDELSSSEVARCACSFDSIRDGEGESATCGTNDSRWGRRVACCGIASHRIASLASTH